MIISHVKIIAFEVDENGYIILFEKTTLYIINRIIHGCLEIPDMVFPRTHVLFSI